MSEVGIHPLRRIRNFPSPRNYWTLIIAATVIGAGLRLATAPRFDFYGDEFWTLLWSQAPVEEILGRFGQGLTMHLYVLFIKVWIYFVGFSPLMVKLPSLVAGVALIPLVFWLGKQCLEPRTAALAAVMTAINCHLIIHSRTARVYLILTVAVLLSMAFFVRFLHTGSKRHLLCGSLWNAVLIALSVHSIYILMVQGIALALESVSRTRLPLRYLAGWVGGIAFSLGLAALFYYRAFNGLVQTSGGPVGAQVSRLAASTRWPTEDLWFPFSTNHLIFPALMLILMGLGAGIAWRQYSLTGRLVVLWAVLPSTLYFLLNLRMPRGSIARYVLPSVPAQLLLIAAGTLFLLGKLIPGSRPRWALLLAILSITGATVGDEKYQRYLVKQQEPTQEAIRRIREVRTPGDIVTSLPEHYHVFLQIHFGEAAVKLPQLVQRRALQHAGRLIIVTRAQPQAVSWWRRQFAVEQLGDQSYYQRAHLVRSKRIPAGPDALRQALEHFYLGFLGAAAGSGRLHRNPVAHYRTLTRVHTRLAYLAQQAGNLEESREHRLLVDNPRAWDGDMAAYPAILARLGRK